MTNLFIDRIKDSTKYPDNPNDYIGKINYFLSLHTDNKVDPNSELYQLAVEQYNSSITNNLIRPEIPNWFCGEIDVINGFLSTKLSKDRWLDSKNVPSNEIILPEEVKLSDIIPPKPPPLIPIPRPVNRIDDGLNKRYPQAWPDYVDMPFVYTVFNDPLQSTGLGANGIYKKETFYAEDLYMSIYHNATPFSGFGWTHPTMLNSYARLTRKIDGYDGIADPVDISKKWRLDCFWHSANGLLRTVSKYNITNGVGTSFNGGIGAYVNNIPSGRSYIRIPKSEPGSGLYTGEYYHIYFRWGVDTSSLEGTSWDQDYYHPMELSPTIYRRNTVGYLVEIS